MDGRGLREESVHRKAKHEGRAVGCGGKLIITVAVPCGGRENFFSPFEREGEAGKLLQLDLVRLDAQHGGSLRLGDVVSEAPLGQKNACDGEFIGDSLAQNGVELPDVEEGLFRVDIDPGEGRRLDGVVFVELVERQLQLSGAYWPLTLPLEAFTRFRMFSSGGVWGLLGVISYRKVKDAPVCRAATFAVQLEKTTPTATTAATSTTAKATKAD